MPDPWPLNYDTWSDPPRRGRQLSPVGFVGVVVTGLLTASGFYVWWVWRGVPPSAVSPAPARPLETYSPRPVGMDIYGNAGPVGNVIGETRAGEGGGP